MVGTTRRFCHNRFQVGHDGRTPYARIRGKPFSAPICEFAESIWFQMPKRMIGPDLNTWDDKWAVGVFLGVRTHSNEIYVGTNTGVVKCRTIRRRPVGERWSAELLNSCRGLPWEPNPSEAIELSAEEQLQPIPEGAQLPEVLVDDKNNPNRSFKIFRSDIIDRERTHGDGYTPHCPGCAAVRSNSAAKNHTSVCRNRYRSIFMNNERAKQRVLAAEARLGITQNSSSKNESSAPGLKAPEAMNEDEAYQEITDFLDNRESLQAPAPAQQDVPMGRDGVLYSPISEGAGPASEPGDIDIDQGDISVISSIAQELIHFGNHIAEVFSPPRVTTMASKVGLRPGFSLDLTCPDPHDGKPWDFSNADKRKRVKLLVEYEKPFLLVGCPPSRPFSTLFSSNISRMDPQVVREIIREGISHINFCMELYRMQYDAGRFFLHEHPWSSWSWQLKQVVAVSNLPNVFVGKGNMCAHDTVLKDRHGIGHVLKATGWMTNSTHIYEEVCKTCPNDGSSTDHRHVSLEDGVAEKASVYQDGLCLAILRGLKNELISRNIMHIGQIGTVCEDPDEYKHFERLSRDIVYDDVSGQELPPDLVMAARREEREGVLRHKVFDQVPIDE